MFFQNRKLMKRTAVILSIMIVMSLVIGMIAPYLL